MILALSHMALEDLLQQIKDSAQKEIRELEEEFALKKERLDKEARAKNEQLEREREQEFRKERTSFLERHHRQKEFELKMKELSLKEELFMGALEKIRKGLALKEGLLKEELAGAGHFINEKTIVFVPPGDVSLGQRLLDQVGKTAKVLEKPGLEEGLLLEGEDFLISLSRQDLFEALVRREKPRLYQLLFGEEQPLKGETL